MASRGRVGVDGGQRPVVAGVHRLEHVEGLAAADLADHDPVRPHAQRVAHQVADGDLALALDVRRPALQPHHVLLLELQLDGVLDGDDALVVGDEGGQHVEQGGLAGAGAAGDDDVQLRLDAGVQQLGHLRGERAELDEVADASAGPCELADGERGAVDGQRRDDGVDARAVRQAGVDHRRGLVDAAADLRHDALDDFAQVVLGGEARVGRVSLPSRST